MNVNQLYRHYDKDNNLLYIGVSLSQMNRLSQHKNHAHWYEQIVKITLENYPDRQSVLDAERLAIINENPMCNLKRPAIEEKVKKVRGNSPKDSKERLTRRIVNFNPVYSMSDAANILDISTGILKRLCEQNKIGYLVVRKRWDKRWNKEFVERKITGWQIIDFLEQWESGLVNIKETEI